MANLGASDVTVTINSRRRVNGRNFFNVTLAFGNGVKQYPSGGIPLTIGNLGCPNIVESVDVTDVSGATYPWNYDVTNKKLVGTNQTKVLGKYTNTTGAGNGAGVETTLFTQLVSAWSMGSAGDRLELLAAGGYAANGNSKTIKVYTGASGTTAACSVALAENGTNWNLRANVALASLSTQSVWHFDFLKGASAAAGSGVVVPNYLDNATDYSAAATIALSGNGTGASDVVLYMAELRYIPSQPDLVQVAIPAQTLKCEIIGW